MNVFEQVQDLAKTSIIQEAWLKGQEVAIHGWVYGVHDGVIKDLKLTVLDNNQLAEVYQLDF